MTKRKSESGGSGSAAKARSGRARGAVKRSSGVRLSFHVTDREPPFRAAIYPADTFGGGKEEDICCAKGHPTHRQAARHGTYICRRKNALLEEDD